MERELTKREIIAEKLRYPSGFITLKPTKHCIERLQERGRELDFLPSIIKVTTKNMVSGKTKDNKRLCSVVVKVRYTCTKWLFLCFNPYDGGLKTVWYKDASPIKGKLNKSLKPSV